jgi:hypothetical protein
MPKSAIIELDTTIVQLRLCAQELVGHRMRDIPHQLFAEAAGLIFEDTLIQCVGWIPHNHTDENLARQVAKVLGLDHSDLFVTEFDEYISEWIYSLLITQIMSVVGPDRFYAWHARTIGTARLLTAGGIMIDLSKLKGQAGVVEIDLSSHWAAAKAPTSSKRVSRTKSKAGPVIFERNTHRMPKVTKVVERPDGKPTRRPRLNETTVVAAMERDRDPALAAELARHPTAKRAPSKAKP